MSVNSNLGTSLGKHYVIPWSSDSKVDFNSFEIVDLYKLNSPLVKLHGKHIHVYAEPHLSHKNPCFQSNIAITNFLVSNTREIRFHDVIGQSTVHMYAYTKNSKTWLTYMAK